MKLLYFFQKLILEQIPEKVGIVELKGFYVLTPRLKFKKYKIP